jgi:hypothetical protein
MADWEVVGQTSDADWYRQAAQRPSEPAAPAEAPGGDTSADVVDDADDWTSIAQTPAHQ